MASCMSLTEDPSRGEATHSITACIVVAAAVTAAEAGAVKAPQFGGSMHGTAAMANAPLYSSTVQHHAA